MHHGFLWHRGRRREWCSKNLGEYLDLHIRSKDSVFCITLQNFHVGIPTIRTPFPSLLSPHSPSLYCHLSWVCTFMRHLADCYHERLSMPLLLQNTRWLRPGAKLCFVRNSGSKWQTWSHVHEGSHILIMMLSQHPLCQALEAEKWCQEGLCWHSSFLSTPEHGVTTGDRNCRPEFAQQATGVSPLGRPSFNLTRIKASFLLLEQKGTTLPGL